MKRLIRFFLALLFSISTQVSLADSIKDLGAVNGNTTDPIAISADGLTVVGSLALHDGKGIQPFLWSKASGVQYIGSPAGSAAALAVSADGSTVVGFYKGKEKDAFIWTKASGLNNLGPIAEYSMATGVSADGSVVVGLFSKNEAVNGKKDDQDHIFMWTKKSGVVDIGAILGDSEISNLGVSADGSVIFGTFTPRSPGLQPVHAFVWTKTSGTTVIDAPNSRFTEAGSITANGSMLVGTDETGHHAFIWSKTSGFKVLNKWTSAGYGISSDGSTIVGQMEDSKGLHHAFVWTQTSGMRDLGTLGGNDAELLGISADGSKAIGRYIAPTDGFSHAFIWRKS